MPSSLQAAGVLALTLLPGALYMWAFERQAGRYGVGLSDRVLRFIGGSAIFLALFAGPLYWLLARYSSASLALRELPIWLAAVPPLYVAMPIAAGTTVGIGLRRGWKYTRFLTGPDPAPRAWDHVFQYNVDGWIRVRLKSGTWLGGAYGNANGRRSYAAGYPESQDLYMAAAVHVDPATGEFELGEDGHPQVGLAGLLLRWEEVEYLEFIEA